MPVDRRAFIRAHTNHLRLSGHISPDVAQEMRLILRHTQIGIARLVR